MTLFAVTIITAISIAVSLIFILVYNHRRQTKTQGLAGHFKEAAAAFNLTIRKQEVLGNRMIGLDDRNNKLLFLEAHGSRHDGYLIGLDEINKCVVKQAYSTIHTDNINNNDLESYVDRIALRLDYTNSANATFLTFYDTAINLKNEMQERARQANVWQNLLSTRLPRTDNLVKERKIPAKRTYASIIEAA